MMLYVIESFDCTANERRLRSGWLAMTLEI